jgi:hypothetical protein
MCQWWHVNLHSTHSIHVMLYYMPCFKPMLCHVAPTYPHTHLQIPTKNELTPTIACWFLTRKACQLHFRFYGLKPKKKWQKSKGKPTTMSFVSFSHHSHVSRFLGYVHKGRIMFWNRWTSMLLFPMCSTSLLSSSH